MFAAPALASALLPDHVSAHLRLHVAAAFLVTVAFALLAHRMRAVDLPGAVAGGVVSFFLYASGGPSAFCVLGAVFLITTAGTRFGQARKIIGQTAESRQGRSAWQVLANLAVGAGLCAVALFLRRPELLLASVASLAEAAADTASSEIGKAATNRAYMITSFRPVKPGTDGGISLIGSGCGVLAAVVVTMVAAWGKLIPTPWIPAAAGAAVLGAFFDSLLGATLQQRGWIGNSSVNLLSTSAAAAIALAFLR